MRLIDADALKQHIKECLAEEKNELIRAVLYAIACKIKMLPTIEQPTWISCAERLPESGVHVLLCCEIRTYGDVHKRYVCDGYYAKRYTEQTWNNSGDIACEYREEDDEYYLLEGWYEIIKNWDDYNSVVIGDFVTHWMPLPQPPKGDE